MSRQIKPDWRIITTYLVLLAAGIPWYWPEGNNILLLGMPAWVTVAIIVSMIVSILTALILVFYRWPGETDSDEQHEDK
jgi:heme/copper-type cytochrome/quinol oxidase subunit 2